jgi:hypothetical protein
VIIPVLYLLIFTLGILISEFSNISAATIKKAADEISEPIFISLANSV